MVSRFFHTFTIGVVHEKYLMWSLNVDQNLTHEYSGHVTDDKIPASVGTPMYIHGYLDSVGGHVNMECPSL